MCLKCSRRQNALRPQRGTRTVLCHFAHVFRPSLTFILLLSSSLHIVFSHINCHHPPSHSIPPFFPDSSSSLQRGKTNSCQGQACTWIPKDLQGQRGPSNFLQRSAGATTHGWKQAREQHLINLVNSVNCAHTHTLTVTQLFESIMHLKPAYTTKVKAECVCDC